jgi:hypothetical protein
MPVSRAIPAAPKSIPTSKSITAPKTVQASKNMPLSNQKGLPLNTQKQEKPKGITFKGFDNDDKEYEQF